MKLLIVTQMVDIEDPVLGFFVRWVEEFAKHVERIEVVCLKEGKHALPANVRVHSLGKTASSRQKAVGSRIQYTVRFLSLAWRFRHDYDAVFVHMNQEYVVIAGWLWKLLGKRVYLWRNHYAGSWLTDIAAAFCTKVFCTSKHSYTAKYKKTVIMPVGVDTGRFFPDARVARKPHSILFLARMSPSKRPEMLIDALAELAREGQTFTASFVGSPLPRDEVYYEGLKEKVRELKLADHVSFHAGVPNSQTLDLYRTHNIFVNTSPSGMLDKTIFEAASSGCLVLTASKDFAALAGPESYFDSSATLAERLREMHAQRLGKEILDEHSLHALGQRLAREMKSHHEKIRVTIVINDFLIGGAQKLLVDMLKRIDRDRFTPVLITLFQFEGRDTFYGLLPSDVVVHKLRFGGYTDVRSWLVLARVLRKERPAVVISNLFFSNTVTRILKILFGYRSIAVEHNTYKNKSALEQVVDRILARATYAIVAVSPTVKSFTAAQESIAPSKFRVINNGIDIRAIQSEAATYNKRSAKESLGLNPDRHYIVSVGRLVSQKNHSLLFEGFAQFAAMHPDYDLLVIGDGGMRSSLEKQVQKLQVGDRVHFFGSRTDVVRFYSISDFFVSTSFIEGFGLAHAEALACGLPLVSTRTAGPDTMIKEGKNGFFINEETSDAVATALDRMVTARPESMRAYALEVALHYDIDHMVRAYEALILEAVEPSSRGL